MDDELRRWAATWKQMEALDMDIVRRTRSAYRTDAVRQLLEVLGSVVGVALFAWWLVGKLSRGELSVADWMLVGAMCIALVYLGVFFSSRGAATRQEPRVAL